MIVYTTDHMIKFADVILFLFATLVCCYLLIVIDGDKYHQQYCDGTIWMDVPKTTLLCVLDKVAITLL